MNIKVDNNTVIVFDLDDTLYNELDYLISSYKEIARLLDSKDDKKLFSIMFSLYRNKDNVFDYLVDNYNVEKEKLIHSYRNHIPTIKLKKGVKKLLKNIKKKNGKIAIITDGRSITQRNKIKALNLESYIDFIAISEEIGEEKPSERAFKKVMNSLSGNKYYYFGDNLKKDFISPNKLEWCTVCLIDNGKNIHSNAYLNQEKNQLAKSYVYRIKEIKIV